VGKSLGEYLEAAFPYTPADKEKSKDAVREWLKNVSLPESGSTEATRRLLEALVDEPE
jgi:hypothetical protein